MELAEQTRKILHVDMDAYYASVEQRDDPKFGVGSAMPGYMAKQKCPDLIFVKPRYEVYSQISRQIRDIFREYTDLIEPLSLDEAYLDITTNKKDDSTADIRLAQSHLFDRCILL